MLRVENSKYYTFSLAFLTFAAMIAVPQTAHASATDTAANARQGKLVAQDETAIRRSQAVKIMSDTSKTAADSSPLPSPAPEVQSSSPVGVDTPTPGTAEPRLLHELQADGGSGITDMGHLKVIGGLLLLLLAGYGAFRRLVPQE